MSLDQLNAIRAMQAENPGPDLNGPPAEVREAFEQMFAAIPLAPDVAFQPAEPGGVPALWSRTADLHGDRVLLYLHGGAYVIGSAQAYRFLWSELARLSGARGLGLHYRLAPENPFPAAVDDAVAAYRWLLDQGIRPGDIVVAGDSAGGGLTIAMLVAAKRQGLPMPAAAGVISPWVDMEVTGVSVDTKAAEDTILDRPGLLAMAAYYLNGASGKEPLASPLHADLSGLPPLLIQVGSAEILLDDATRLAAKAAADGVRTRLEVWPDMPHVWHAYAFALDEGRAAMEELAGFLKANLSRP